MKTLYLILTLFITSLAFGQTQTELLQETKKPIYSPLIKSGKQLYLNMSYGSSYISNKKEITDLKNATIASVDIVYSDYPKDWKHEKLTTKRIEEIKALNPSLLTNKKIQWNLIRQTNCKDKNSASKLYHGIVITYRPAPTKEETEKEIAFIEKIFVPVKSDSIITEAYAIYPETKASRKHKKKHRLDFLRGGEYSDEDLAGTRTGKLEPVYKTSSSFGGFKDSTVTKVLNRNNWINSLIVGDLTGSMYPYTGQLLAWYKLNTKTNKAKQFVFFNDGNHTPDRKKIIGKTGGIYSGVAANFEKVKKLATTTMRNGCGGDAPENDIEAILKGIEDCPSCNDIVLIADNWAPIKDIKLIKKLNKPIKVVLCGVYFGVNTEYLDLVKVTGGSLHTIEEDLTNLAKMNEGEVLNIGNQKFKLENGKFMKLTEI